MFRRSPPLSSKLRAETDAATASHGRATLLTYQAQSYFAISKPPIAHPLYNIEEVIDSYPTTNIETLRADIRQHTARSAAAAYTAIDVSNPDAKGNWIVMITYIDSPLPETKIWHPVMIEVRDTDGTTYDSKYEPKKAYVIASPQSPAHPKFAHESMQMILRTLPNALYLLSHTPHTRAHFDSYYRSHYAPKTSLWKSLQEFATPKPKSKVISTTDPATIRPKTPTPRPSTPTTASTSTWFAQSLRRPTTPTAMPWK